MTDRMKNEVLKSEAFRTKMSKRVEHVALFVVFDVDHSASLQSIDIARIAYHKTKKCTSEIDELFK